MDESAKTARDSYWDDFVKSKFHAGTSLKDIFDWGFRCGGIHQWYEQQKKQSETAKKAWVTRRKSA
jgi:hypothetical protein